MNKNVHEGHRSRMKTKFREHGLDSFTDVEALELLLYYAVPRADTNVPAHALLDEFHSFRGVLEADVSELQRVPGIGENAATLLALVTALNARYQRSVLTRGMQIRSAEEAGAFLMPQFAYRNAECCVLLSMDNAGHVIDCHTLAEGSASMVELDFRNVVELVLRDHAARVILAHNHVTGVALPSDADLKATEKLYRMLQMIGVDLVDHFVFSDEDYVSMRDSGHFTGF